MDSETRDALIAVCETLKEEFRYLAALQHGMSRLHNAVVKELPAVDQHYSKLTVEIKEHPGTVARIQLIDGLLEKLQKV